MTDGDNISPVEVRDFAKMTAPAAPGHAETLVQRIEYILSTGGCTVRDVDLFVCGHGPGTFTGLRIGLSTIKGLALAWDKPIVGISSLEALAFSAPVEGAVATLIDARRGELFAGVYEVARGGDWPDAKSLVPEWVAPASEVVARLKDHVKTGPLFLVGNGVGPYTDLIRRECRGEAWVILPPEHWVPDPVTMSLAGLKRFLDRGSDDLNGAEPVYIREPDAKLPRPC